MLASNLFSSLVTNIYILNKTERENTKTETQETGSKDKSLEEEEAWLAGQSSHHCSAGTDFPATLR